MARTGDAVRAVADPEGGRGVGMTYYKRFRMEIDTRLDPVHELALPAGYSWNPWSPRLLERHANVKFESFRGELDASVFPCLGEAFGCLQLMESIATRSTFLPAATWMISHTDPEGRQTDCGTIQGIVQLGGWGAIQNVGVAPEHRGKGLGRALVHKALIGFWLSRVPRVYLEATAKNFVAVQLYRSIGFRLARTSYKTVTATPADEIVT